MDNSLLQLIAVISGVVALFGWSLKLILPYFMRKLDERDVQIEQMTEKFTQTINHKTTEHTEAIDKLSILQERHTSAVEQQTQFLQKAIEHIIHANGKH